MLDDRLANQQQPYKSSKSESVAKIFTYGTVELLSILRKGLIASASGPEYKPFTLHNFEEYSIDIQSEDRTVWERVVIDSGIGSILCKEEWRGEIVGNLFYPKNSFDENKAIIHINGVVPLIQDGRYVKSYSSF